MKIEHKRAGYHNNSDGRHTEFRLSYVNPHGRIITVTGRIKTEHGPRRVAQVYRAVTNKIENAEAKKIDKKMLKRPVKNALHHSRDLSHLHVTNHRKR